MINQMNTALYTDIYREWLRLMSYFGKLASLAFSDIRLKANTIDKNSVLINGILPPAMEKIHTIEDLI